MSTPADKFGAVCLQAGFITAEQLDEVLLDLTASGDGADGGALTRRALGVALVERGYLTKRQVREVLALQKRELYGCPACGKRFVVKDHDGAATYKCKACGKAPLAVVEIGADVHFDAQAGKSAEVAAVEPADADGDNDGDRDDGDAESDGDGASPPPAPRTRSPSPHLPVSPSPSPPPTPGTRSRDEDTADKTRAPGAGGRFDPSGELHRVAEPRLVDVSGLDGARAEMVVLPMTPATSSGDGGGDGAGDDQAVNKADQQKDEVESVACPGCGTEIPVKKAEQRKYVVEGRLGHGGMGEVLSARDPALDRSVAVKLSLYEDRRRVRRFVHEAQVTAQLEHPNIIPVHEVGVTEKGRAYFAMKRVAGQTLGDVLHAVFRDDEEAAAKWPLPRLIEVFLKVCDGMAFAHSRRVIHRDLKPSNIMVGEFGEVLVMDWGLARVLDEKADEALEEAVRTVRTQEGASRTQDGIGTPSYMPPEQADPARADEVDERADIYALGAVLYEMLCGQPPFTWKTTEEIVEKFLTANLRPPEDVVVAHARSAPVRASGEMGRGGEGE
ncbi:MAG: serine/threonine protein kinase, partial [Planctomycetes bacterium]|nr:serine/threonine protein kinase [Planctomycetota bacterium]